MTNLETHDATVTDSGYALGSIRQTLRLEGFTVLAIAVASYWQLDGSWWRFFGLLLWPDLAFLAYIKNSRVGAQIYNLLHSYVGPLAIGLSGSLMEQKTLILFALNWAAHIGMDRFVGYGLKYPEQPEVTHLGIKGKSVT